jgi:hypothetical protein
MRGRGLSATVTSPAAGIANPNIGPGSQFGAEHHRARFMMI